MYNSATGEVCRGGKDYKLRYQETLESRTHNHLRVCRILSSFSVLGFRRYKAPLVHFLQEEAGFVEGERLGKTRALKLSPHALRMFGTYLDEESKEYLMYSGVQLPGDHADHVLFTFLGTDREDELFELPERGSAHAKASADPVIPMDGGDGRTKSTGGDDVDTEAEDGENVSCVRAAGGVEAAAIPIGDDATVGLSGILDEPSRDIEAVVGVSGETVQLTPPVPILHDEVKKPAVAGSDYEAAASEIEGADFD
jgi:Opioid growth factor receptor (OGFr) conserved region